MDYLLHCAHQGAWFFGFPVLLAICVWRYRYFIPVRYAYPLAGSFLRAGLTSKSKHVVVSNVVRFFILLLLAFLLLKPQLVDTRSEIKVAGIDIMLVLDISGSMQNQDFEDDARSRVEIAKDEAIAFVNKRANDAIGLVVFGKDAFSRCPATLDKSMLTACVKGVEVGMLDPQGTVLSTALLMAINRLKDSQAKSRVVILLTDGEPSKEDSDPAVPIEIARKVGIKVYTIGIGNDEPGQVMHPFFGLIQKPGVNVELLKRIASETGGRFFMARSAADMRDIYTVIDTLEKSSLQFPLFSRYYDLGVYGAFIILFLITSLCGLHAYRWFGL